MQFTSSEIKRARGCPVCGDNAGDRVLSEANIRFEELDSFAFSSRKLPEYMHHRLLQCSQCNLVYAYPVPAQSSLARAYRDADFDSTVEAGFASKTYRNQVNRIINSLPDQEGALDIGTGDGAFLEHLLEMKFTQVQGVEPSSAPLTAAKPSIRALIHEGMFMAELFGEQQFSIVTCFQTIEHVLDPLSLSCEVNRLLKAGGAFMIVCHNAQSFSARVLGKRSPIYDVEHLQLFSPTSLRHMLVRSGYSDIQVRPIRNRYPVTYWIKLAPLPRKIKLGLIAWISRTPLRRLCLTIPAGNIVALGFKK